MHLDLNLENLYLAAIMSVATATLSFLAANHWAHVKSRKDSNERVRALELQIALLTQQVSPLWTAAQSLLIKQMTHYHAPEMDALLRKIGPPFVLTIDEEARLYVLLAERTRDMGELIDNSEREAAAMLPFIIKRVRAASALPALAMEIMVVSVPRVAAEPGQ